MKNILLKHKKSVFILLALICSFTGFSNNVQIANIALTGQNTTAKFKMIKFDLSWNNSWRTSASPNNWDAAWVFAKYRLTSGTNWMHATLNTSYTNHTAATGSSITPTTDGKGAFIYRSADGAGTNNFLNTQLRWEYGTDGLADGDSVEICLFAIEMVYIPQGSFTLGDGNGSATSPYGFRIGTTNNPPLISTTIVGNIRSGSTAAGDDAQLATSGIGIKGDTGIDIDDNGSVDNANFPTGYKAFYVMKYEVTQGQYVEFLNKLTTTQGALRGVAIAGTYRHNITGSTNSWSSVTPFRAHGYLSWMDMAAYLDWSGLRPMTELEYEKACRGPQTPATGEYAWGTNSVVGVAYTFSFDGTASENILNMGGSTGNAAYSSTIGGVVRNGIFASSSAAHTRIETGSTFYGVMEMSGNVSEYTVTIGDPSGRLYNGSHGDGALSNTGNCDQATWPGLVAGQVTAATGTGSRGGDFIRPATYMVVSDRSLAGTEVVSRPGYQGGRGVRTAP